MNSCFKIHAKGAAAPDSDASYNCGFSKGKWPSASHHNGAAYRRHPWRQSANANIVFALPLRLNHFPRKSHSLRRIYARECSPFLLETSHLSVGTGDRKKLICALKPRYGALHTRFDDHAPRNENYRGFIDHN